MNPSFKPPPPISDKQRETIYRLYWLNPRQYNVRKLSKIFNISLKRVTAILRLKNLEKNWIKVSDFLPPYFCFHPLVFSPLTNLPPSSSFRRSVLSPILSDINSFAKGKELQTGFLFGMERLLKAQTHNAVKPLRASLDQKKKKSPDYLETLDVHPHRSDVYKADLIEQKEQRDTVKAGFEHLYWETIPESSKVSLDQPFSFPCSRVDSASSQEPILPLSIQEAEKTAISWQKRREAKANHKFMRRIPDTEFIKTPTYKVLTLTRKSGPTTRFVDVGSAFMNAHELEKRRVVSQRKSRARARMPKGVARFARRKLIDPIQAPGMPIAHAKRSETRVKKWGESARNWGAKELRRARRNSRAQLLTDSSAEMFKGTRKVGTGLRKK
jgi:hypothetical protein